MKFLPYVRWCVGFVIVGYVLWQAFISVSPVTQITDFVNRTPLFSVLLPAARVERVAQGMSLRQEPVYVDVRLPLRVQAIELELFSMPSSSNFKVAVQRGPGFELEFSPIEVLASAAETKYRVRVTDFPYLEPGTRVRFVISAPGLTPGAITVTRAQVTILRQPFSLAWLKSLARGFPERAL